MTTNNLVTNTIIPFDLKAQDRIIRGRMPTLEIIHDRFVRLFRLSLSKVCRQTVVCSLKSTELIKYREFLKNLPSPSPIHVFRMNPLRGNALLTIDNRLFVTIIDLVCGGTGKLEKDLKREYTALEMQLWKPLLQSLLNDLQTAWKPVFPLVIQYHRTEVNPEFVAIVPHSDIVIIVTFEVKMGEQPMAITLCVPYASYEPILDKLNASFQSEDETDNLATQRFTGNIRHSLMDVVVQKPGYPITVQQLLQLKKGDILMSPQKMGVAFDIVINHEKKFRGNLIEKKKHQAIVIQESVEASHWLDEFSEPSSSEAMAITKTEVFLKSEADPGHPPSPLQKVTPPPLKHSKKPRKVSPKTKNRDQKAAELFQDTLVQVMSLSLEYWRITTGKDKIALAEESGIWNVFYDKDSPRTRTLDNYLNINKVPKKQPRVQDVIATAHFVLRPTSSLLSQQPHSIALRTIVEKNLQQLYTLVATKK